MSRVQMTTDIMNIFASPQWTSSTDIRVTPDNYTGNPGGEEFIRPNIILGTSVPNFRGFEYSGQIRFDIFTRSGVGTKRAAELVDLLSNVFERKKLSSSIQTFIGTMVPRGTDPNEPQYYRVNYAVPFNYFN